MKTMSHNRFYGRLLPTPGRLIFTLLLFVIIQVESLAQCESLVWQDEFNNSALDQSKWDIEVGGGGWGTGQLDYATARPENIRIENGKLVLEIRKENYEGHQYTSGRIRTYKKVDFQYGRIEARLKGVYSQGNGFAFWLLGSDFESVWWPKCGEVDIFENTGKYPGKNIGTSHYQESWGHAWNQGSYTLPNNARWADDFHTAAIEWSPTYIKYFIDGNLYHTFDISNPINGYKPFNRPFFIILSVGMGGSYSGPPDATTVSPMKAEIEYIRVYKGTYSTFITGDDKIYKGEISKDYSVNVASAGHTFNWTVPAGATIAAGQGTNKVTVNWGQSGGDVSVSVGSSCGTNSYKIPVTAEEPFVADKVYENFEVPASLTYGAMSGTLTKDVANPNTTNTVNTSAKVGRYTRNATQQYDYMTLTGLNSQPNGELVYGRRKILLDVYTDAPVGTKVSLNLENGNVSTGTNYPSGRYAIFDAVTTRQNTWETLEFNYTSSPDVYGSAAEVNQWILLFAPVTNTGYTFHYDNLRTGYPGGFPATVYNDVLQNYDGTAKLTKDFSNGVYTVQANPSVTAPNNSPTVAKYVRDADSSYDALVFKTDAIVDAYNFKKGNYKVMMDVFTDAPIGTRLSMNFEVSAFALPDNWPAGRHSNYEAVTTKQNQWETVTFYISATPDKGASDAAIDKIVFLFNPVTNTSNTYYIDNVRIASAVPKDNYVLSTVWEDYDANRKLTLKTTTGTYSPAINTPSPGGVNTSPEAATYVRNATQQWDLLVFNKSTAVVDGKKLKERKQKIAMDIYTDAPAGTEISIGFDASTLALPDNYPTGRHSNYQAFTKAQNSWHTVYFTYAASPDPSTPDNLIDNVALLFAPGKLTGNTFHIDNIRVFDVIPETNPLASITVTPQGNTISVGQTLQFTAVGKDANGNTVSITPTWSVSSGGTISQAGLFTASGSGVTTVTATSGNISGTSTVTISGVSGSSIPGRIEAESYATMNGVAKENTSDVGGGQNIGYIDGGDWMDYSVNVQATGNYAVTFRVAGWNASAQVQLRSGATVLATVNVPNTGGGQVWATTSAATIPLSAGNQTLRVQVINGGFNYNWMEFSQAGGNISPSVSITTPSNNAVLTGLGTVTIAANATDSDGTVSRVEFLVNGNLLSTDTSSPFTATWTPTAAGTYTLTARAFDNLNANTTSSPINVTVTTGGVGANIPGKIEAENYATMSGVAKENTADAGGGQNVGYIDSGDWMDFPVIVQNAGTYAVTFRLAGWNTTAQLQLRNGATVLATVNVPNTGGGQNWSTTTAQNVTLPSGNITLRVHVVTGGFNFNWINFAAPGARIGLEEAVVETNLYPNPSRNIVTISGIEEYPAKITIVNQQGGVLFDKIINSEKEANFDLTEYPIGTYYITVKNKKVSRTERIIKD
ncbi:carbohydrate-binding protein [Pseudochryseolinea flava]|nr:carbohydrate-binding protein [Pseudochryseolinea flava]